MSNKKEPKRSCTTCVDIDICSDLKPWILNCWRPKLEGKKEKGQMSKIHKEFTKELIALMDKYSAEIRVPNDENEMIVEFDGFSIENLKLGTYVDNSQYELQELDLTEDTNE